MAHADILSAAGVHAGQPILGLDLDAVRARVSRRSAGSRRRGSCACCPTPWSIDVVERRRWPSGSTAGRSYVIDAQGQVIPEADPGRFRDLPLVVGAGRRQRSRAEILPLIRPSVRG